ncbi:MAG: hypothetical protein CM1200mP28_12080 [Deltaproteobacteria bacterium]|nr:MAG: hypothetical protein CM1200mP28_12080 [Deltaproteobacteria bacterium]
MTDSLLFYKRNVQSRNAKLRSALSDILKNFGILAVIDENFAGQDAGKIVTGKNLNIPIHASIRIFSENKAQAKYSTEKFARGLHAIMGLQLPVG